MPEKLWFSIIFFHVKKENSICCSTSENRLIIQASEFVVLCHHSNVISMYSGL